MKITDITVFPINDKKLKAYISITLDGSFVIRDLRIINGNTGFFVAMPSRRQKNGLFKDIAHPINQETRDKIEKAIFEAYEKEIQSIGSEVHHLKAKGS